MNSVAFFVDTLLLVSCLCRVDESEGDSLWKHFYIMFETIAYFVTWQEQVPVQSTLSSNLCLGEM